MLINYAETFVKCNLELRDLPPKERNYKIRMYYLNYFLVPLEDEVKKFAFYKDFNQAISLTRHNYDIKEFINCFQESTVQMIKAFLLREIYIPEQPIYPYLEEKHQILLEYFRSRLAPLLKTLR